MPRKLPWQTTGSSTTTVARSKRPAVASTAIQKRQRKVRDSSVSGTDEAGPSTPSTRKERAYGERPRSSSLPPSPPPESFMVEGMDDDDKYRMVEDEFLTIAQRFTVHLHAAEYKRQQKMAKTRNAETINSISRPVTGKMPDQTKRKLEAIERANAQRTIVESLVGKKAKGTELSDDSEDDTGLPYFGTSLHGLMDSPSRKKASLKKISAAATTRAAAGFKQSAQSKTGQRRNLGSPQPRQTVQRSRPDKVLDGDETESSDDDDDLDAAPKPSRPIQKAPVITKASIIAKREVKVSDIQRIDPKIPPRSKDPVSSFKDVRKTIKLKVPSTQMESPPKVRGRLSRFEQARERRAKEEQEQQAKKKLDVIPTFL